LEANQLICGIDDFHSAWSDRRAGETCTHGRHPGIPCGRHPGCFFPWHACLRTSPRVKSASRRIHPIPDHGSLQVGMSHRLRNRGNSWGRLIPATMRSRSMPLCVVQTAWSELRRRPVAPQRVFANRREILGELKADSRVRQNRPRKHTRLETIRDFKPSGPVMGYFVKSNTMDSRQRQAWAAGRPGSPRAGHRACHSWSRRLPLRPRALPWPARCL
jgi:hypothetical protein